MSIGDLARRLVEIPSHEDETAAGDALVSWLREETEATVTRDDVGNVFARRGPGTSTGGDPSTPPDAADASTPPDADLPTLALVGHHDVVPPADRQRDGEDYVVETRRGRLHGRGTADMKGALAAMAHAFRDADPACPLEFVSFVGEEVGGEGCRAAIDDGFRPAYAVVGEGTTDYSGSDVTDVAVAHRGRRASTLVARGAAAHASEPEAGENAVYRACDAVDALRDLPFPETEVLGHAVSGSLAVTGIEGGTAWNVVPDACEITVDERTVPGKRAPIDRVAVLPDVEWEVDQDLPPMACDDAAFADLVLDVATGVQEGSPEHVVKPHATDAGWLADAGTTCVVCGPAEPGEAHTKTESVSFEALERCYRVYRGVAERLSEVAG